MAKLRPRCVQRDQDRRPYTVHVLRQRDVQRWCVMSQFAATHFWSLSFFIYFSSFLSLSYSYMSVGRYGLDAEQGDHEVLARCSISSKITRSWRYNNVPALIAPCQAGYSPSAARLGPYIYNIRDTIGRHYMGDDNVATNPFSSSFVYYSILPSTRRHITLYITEKKELSLCVKRLRNAY